MSTKTHSEIFHMEGVAYDAAHEEWNRARLPIGDDVQYWRDRLTAATAHMNGEALRRLVHRLEQHEPSAFAHDCNPVQTWHDV